MSRSRSGARRQPFWWPVLAVVLVLVLVGCGSSGVDPVEIEASDASASSTVGSTTTTAEPPPTSDDGTGASIPAGGLDRCQDIPKLEATVEGSLSAFANPDDEVVGVLITYGMEHPDTFAGFWIDRNHGGTLVLAFTDDPEPHRAAVLARGPSVDDVETVSPRPPIRDPRPLGDRDDIAIDVVRATFSETELKAASDRFWADRPSYVLSGGVSTTKNRMTLDLIDPTTDQLADLATRVDPAMTCVTVSITPTPPSGPLDVLAQGDATLTCGPGGGSVHGFPASALDQRIPVDEVDEPAVEALQRIVADPPSGAAYEDIEQPPPRQGWFVLRIDADTAVFGHGDQAPYSAAFLHRDDGEWELAGWTSRCVPGVELPAGLGPVRVTFDPNHPRPQPEDTVVHLLVTEQACASGQPMGDRLRGPQVVESDDRILIALAVEVQMVPTACPANPSQPVTVELSQPVGDRPITNGLAYPPGDIDFPSDR